MRDPTKRFSSRVDAYVKYRPSYPETLFDALERECALSGPSVIADVGSGTGIATEILLRRGHRVYGIEPNAEMRDAAERLLAPWRDFVSIDGRAEATGLDGHSVDLVFAAQAFHWFDPAACRREFARILRPPGNVALAWNDRSVDASPFLVAYEALLRAQSIDYDKVKRGDDVSGTVLDEFFSARGHRTLRFANWQDFDREGLIGRALSSSYVPGPGHPGHERFFAELGRIHETYAEAGRVRFEYTTSLYLGRVE